MKRLAIAGPMLVLVLALLACSLSPVFVSENPTPTLIALQQLQTVVSIQQTQTAIAQIQASLSATPAATTPAPPTLVVATSTPLPSPTVRRPTPRPTTRPALPPTLPPPPPLPIPLAPSLPPPPPPGYFRLVNRHSQKCLTAPGGGGPVVQMSCANGWDNQLWYLPSDVSIGLLNRTGVCVGYDPSNASNTLFQVGCNGTEGWQLVRLCDSYGGCTNPIAGPHPHAIVAPLALGAYYELQYQGECVDVDSWNHDEGGKIIHDTCRLSDNDNQLWARY